MNNEIKEILDKLKDTNNYISHSMILLSIKETIAILDYIINLQQENQELNDSNQWWNNRFNAVQRDYEDYKSKIKKATEILKDTNVDMPSTLLIETIDYGINILNGKER